jgi:flagellar motor switch protein FliN/FliY
MTGKPNTAPHDSTSALEGYLRALLDGSAAALSALLGRPVIAELEGAPRSFAEPLGASFPPPWLVAEARSSAGPAGSHDFVFPGDDAAQLAALVPGAEGGDADESLRDLLAQMLASASSMLGGFARPATLSLGELRRVAVGEEWTPRGPVFGIARVLVDGAPRARVAVTVPAVVCDELAAGPAPRPAAAPERAVPTTAGLDIILDISMPITVELGRTRMLIRDILNLGPGSVVELDKLAGESVDLLVNDRPIAKGEVVVIDENFGIRLTQISQAAERIRSLS